LAPPGCGLSPRGLPDGRTRAALCALTSGLDLSCDESSKGASAEVAMAPRVQAPCGT